MKKPIYPCLWFDGNAKEAADDPVKERVVSAFMQMKKFEIEKLVNA